MTLPDTTGSLRADVAACGYFPDLVSDGVLLALGDEPLVRHLVHHEATFQEDSLHRHLTVLALTETRLVVGQALELRLAVDESLLIYRRGRSSPEMRRVSGPERRTIDGRVYQVWVFAAVIGGHATIRMEYAQNEQAAPARVVEFPVDVHFN